MKDKIEFTPDELSAFAKRCATLGRDMALSVLADLGDYRVLSEDHESVIVTNEQIGAVAKVTARQLTCRFDAVIDDPIGALWQRELFESLPVIIAAHQLFLEENRS